MERKEKLCQPPEYPAEMFAEYFERAKERALRTSEIEAILGDDYDLDRLRELVEADRDGRVKIHPKPEKKTCGSDVREKLVEILKQAPFEGKVLDEWWWEEKIVRIVDHLIANGVTVQEWISVDDRLPDEAGRYLAVKKRIAPDELGGSRTDIVILRFFVDDGFRMPTHIPDWINEEINEEVTHWMPLPQPPIGV